MTNQMAARGPPLPPLAQQVPPVVPPTQPDDAGQPVVPQHSL